MLTNSTSGTISDFQWQLKHTVFQSSSLKKYISLSAEQAEAIHTVNQFYKMAITPYYLSLMDRDDVLCPIKKQVIPTYEEMQPSTASTDPLEEEHFSPVPHLIHKYPDRVLLLVTNACFSYCRHCTRKRLMSEQNQKYDITQALDYIRKTPQIKDVLISGGDPLFLSDLELNEILSSIRKIEHVETIRIGTRAPVVMPMRITPELVSTLRKHHPIWINTHFNHPKEITTFSMEACRLLIDSGFPLGNQTVLLKGINDDSETITHLMRLLVKNRIRPYYLYQCDKVKGVEHFITPLTLGMDIIRSMRGHISGLAIPLFVVDAPGLCGKIVLEPDRITAWTETEIMVQNYQNQQFSISLDESTPKT